MLPESVAVSVKSSPTSPEAFETCVVRTGCSQKENWPRTKSESVELGSCEDRVSARKVEKQPVSRPRAVRSMPPSYRAPAPPLESAGKTLAVPDLGVYGHGAFAEARLVMAHTFCDTPLHSEPVPPG